MSNQTSLPSSSSGRLTDSFSGSFTDDQLEPGQHALVIGCGVAGMAAAQVLSKHFERVTVLERDALPDEPKFRAGKPQGRHAHILMGQGQRYLEAIFPGLITDLRKHGAMKWQWGPEPHWYHYGGWRRKFPTALTTVLCSVNLIEWAMRRQLQINPQVRILTECTVEELLSDGKQVIGLRVQHHRKGRGQKALELRSALVVDTTGRRSMAPEWLTKLGFGPVPETKVEAFWGYASRYYERPSQTKHDWKVLAIHPTPPDSARSGMLFPLENNLWLVTLAGTNRDYPPDDDAGFLEFTRGLSQPTLYEAIREAKPVSGIYGYRYAENRLRHFEKQERYLEGFVVLGDAVCQFNPIYGQGMSVAAIGAVRLSRCVTAHLKRHPNRDFRGLSRTFQKGLARDLMVPWLITTSEDLRFAKSDVPGKNSLLTRLMQSVVKNVVELAATDYQAYRGFLSVMHLVSSPLRLLHPWLVVKVILHALFAPPPPKPMPKLPRPAPRLAPSSSTPAPRSGEAWPALITDPSMLQSFATGPSPLPSPSSFSGPTAPSSGTPSQLPMSKPLRK